MATSGAAFRAASPIAVVATVVALSAFYCEGVAAAVHKCSRSWPQSGLGAAGALGATPVDVAHVQQVASTMPLPIVHEVVASKFPSHNISAHRVSLFTTMQDVSATLQLDARCSELLGGAFHGSLHGEGSEPLVAGSKLPSGCSVVYRPGKRTRGQDFILYSVGSTGEAAAAAIEIVPCNEPAQATDDIVEGKDIVGGRVIRIKVLDNDVDPEESSWACIQDGSKFASQTESSQSPTSVHFTNVAKDLGLKQEQCEIRTSPNCLFDQYDPQQRLWDRGGFCLEETLTGGACIGDADGDGHDDIFYPRLDGHDVLYRNRGDGSFEDASKEAGIARWIYSRSNACQFLDIDNDGDNDIYVSTVADDRFYLFVNDGTGRFTEEAEERGLDNVPMIERNHGHKTAGNSIDVADIDLDGDLDIVTTEWMPHLDKQENQNQEQHDAIHNAPGANNGRVYLNLGPEYPGYFEDVTQEVGVRNFMPHQGIGERMLNRDKKAFYRGSNEEFVAALKCLEVELTGSESRNQLVDTYRRTVNKLRGLPEERDHFGVRHPAIGYYRGEIKTKSGTQHNKHEMHVFSNGTWELVDMVTVIATNETTRHVSTGHWKDDPNDDYILHVTQDGQEGKTSLALFGDMQHSDLREYIDMMADQGMGLTQDLIDRGMVWASPFAHFILMEAKPENRDFQALKPAGAAPGVDGMKLVYISGPSDEGVLESAKFVNYACNRMSQHMNKSMVVSELNLVWHNTMNADSTDRAQKLLESHHARPRQDPSQLQERIVQVVSKANAMNMSVMEYRSWEDNRRHLAQYSAAKGGHIHRMSHLGGFGSLNGVFTFGVKFIDLDEDWFPDLILSGDFGTSQMLWNQKNGTYVQGYFDVLEDLMDNSMGCTVGDWDQDGKTDIMFTSVSISSDEMKGLSKVQDGAGMALTFAGNHLYKNLGDRRFRDRTDVAGVRLSGWGWGAFFFDFDNDGDLDVLNGNGMDDPETTDDDVFVNQDMRLYVNQGADENYKYVDEAHERGINDQGDNRGSMSFDYDGDGDLDVFIVNHGEAPALYRNEGGDYNDWLRVKVQESPSRGRRPAIGAKVYVMLRAPSSEAARTGKAANEIMREIKNAAAFCGQNELVAHFGLGKTPLQNGAVHRVRIVWPPMSPGGEPDTVELYQVPIRNVLVVHRPAKDASHRVLTAGATLPICSEKRITQVTAPQHGQAVLDSSKRFVKYRAASGYVGSDEFSYSMTDGLGVTSKARVRVEVAEVQDPQAKLAMKLARPSKHATFNGKHNNVQNVEHNAAAFTRLVRLAPPAYVDGYEEPPGATRPSAREISNVLFAQRESREDPRGLNDLCLHFGQFVAHDVSFVTPLADFYAAGNMAIRVPEGDPTFDPDFTGEAVIRFRRSGADQGTGKDYGVPRQQVNKVTGWLDLSVVYGSGPERADAIKTAKRGKIEMQGDAEDHLAYNSKGLPNLNLLGKRVERLVVSGDNRVNVQPGLLTLHTLWAREHNRVANQLLIDSPTMTDREIFMEARRQTISTYQQVVMYEYLPAILGWKSMHELGVISTEEVPSEYIPTTDARVSNEFASVAFRFGHSQVTDTLHRFDADLKTSEHGHLHLRDNYFSPGRVLKQGGLDPILRGMIRTACQAVDTKAMDGVRNFLFGTNTKGFDLAAINIQRGRDHGILDYNSLRRELGLAPRQNFTDITSDSDVASKLAKLYSSVDDIDAFVGGLAEDHVEGGAVGELFAWIIGNQFRRLRSGDRLWFEHGKLPSERRLTRLSDVIKRNSGLNDDDAVWQDVKNSFFVPGKRNPRPFIRRTEL